ncbi:hypothetical protein [Tepidibacter formicigenes]|jgi:hypothetical protein|uniref:Uncharacterized protein n=1 Tax=Tepidibacter formicigenes DSM 15518 TaxID=1123349 RepID=A0A1M6Q1N0_9FIRM|nr:hypothetical protein [Tepidibacter formicigenes]SHK14119.1 hypothetical protein SAMN02744037_01717 [Tepidibacter formicigenes DSM 15518]
MAYNRTFWKDHVTQYENRYREVNNGDGTITHEPIEGEVIQQGTPQNEPNFNNIEEGVFAANEMGSEATRVLLHHDQTLKKLIGEAGETTLTNSLEYPFNNSIKTIAIATKRDTTDYTVDIDAIATGGDIGRIEVTDKQLNGFKIAFTGSAKSVNLKYIVKGGIY